MDETNSSFTENTIQNFDDGVLSNEKFDVYSYIESLDEISLDSLSSYCLNRLSRIQRKKALIRYIEEQNIQELKNALAENAINIVNHNITHDCYLENKAWQLLAETEFMIDQTLIKVIYNVDRYAFKPDVSCDKITLTFKFITKRWDNDIDELDTIQKCLNVCYNMGKVLCTGEPYVFYDILTAFEIPYSLVNLSIFVGMLVGYEIPMKIPQQLFTFTNGFLQKFYPSPDIPISNNTIDQYDFVEADLDFVPSEDKVIDWLHRIS